MKAGALGVRTGVVKREGDQSGLHFSADFSFFHIQDVARLRVALLPYGVGAFSLREHHSRASLSV